MNRADPQSICRLLETLRIPYRMVEHPAAGAMEDLVAVEERLGVRICKNLFLCNRQKTVFYLLLIPADKRFKTSVVSKLIGSSRLSFGEEDKLYELLGVRPGSITPLGLVFDEAHQVNLLIDREVLALEEIGMHPLVNTASIAMKTEDLMKVYFPFTGHEPQILDIPGETEE
ncbi:MAG: prolyl-tRNA synthetase associated domain-containing protein [Butyricicoccaceae bacterium]